MKKICLISSGSAGGIGHNRCGHFSEYIVGLCLKYLAVLFAVPVLFSSCARDSAQIIPVAVCSQETAAAEEAISVLPTAPVTVYRDAVESYLCPLDDYSWEREYPPEFVMLHFTSAVVTHREDPYNNAHLRTLFQENDLSVHYLIQRDGTVYCYIPENRVAWHAGVGTWQDLEKYENTMNYYAIGIEMAAIGSAADMEKYLPAGTYETLDESLIGFTEAQYIALDALLTDLCGRYEIPRDSEHIIGHEAYSPEKNDPGELFDWSRVIGQ